MSAEAFRGVVGRAGAGGHGDAGRLALGAAGGGPGQWSAGGRRAGVASCGSGSRHDLRRQGRKWDPAGAPRSQRVRARVCQVRAPRLDGLPRARLGGGLSSGGAHCTTPGRAFVPGRAGRLDGLTCWGLAHDAGVLARARRSRTPGARQTGLPEDGGHGNAGPGALRSACRTRPEGRRHSHGASSGRVGPGRLRASQWRGAIGGGATGRRAHRHDRFCRLLRRGGSVSYRRRIGACVRGRCGLRGGSAGCDPAWRIAIRPARQDRAFQGTPSCPPARRGPTRCRS
jgi:hypothetical protein